LFFGKHARDYRIQRSDTENCKTIKTEPDFSNIPVKDNFAK
jgi:hypothetical protein